MERFVQWFALSICVYIFLGGGVPSAWAEDYSVISQEELSYIILSDQNYINMMVTHHNKPIGIVEAYDYQGGYMLPLKALSDILGFHIEIDSSRAVAHGWTIKENHIFVLNANKKTVIIGGKEQDIPQDLVFSIQEEIYVDASLLSQLFPVTFHIDPVLLNIDIRVSESMPDKEHMQLIKQLIYQSYLYTGEQKPRTQKQEEVKKAVPIPVKRQHQTQPQLKQDKKQVLDIPQEGPLDILEVPEVSFDAEHVIDKPEPELEALPEKLVESPAIAEEEDVLRIDNADKDKHLPLEAVTLTDEGFLVLEVEINKEKFTDFLEGYDANGHLFLPLDSLVRLFEFPIEVDAEAGTASGWFINESKEFSLNLEKQQSESAGVSIPLPPHAIQQQDGDIYVHEKMISQWFPMTFDLNYRSMTLNVELLEALPFQQRRARKHKWDRIAFHRARKKEASKFDRVHYPYKALAWPFVDVSLGSNYRNGEEGGLSSNYSIKASGDFAYHTSDVFITGNDTDNYLNSIRFKLGRKDIDPNLLGFMGVREYDVGDVRSHALPLVTKSGLGRGISLSSYPLNNPTEFDKTDFTGDIQPDWEVELYRNDALLDFQTVNENGQYEFLDVPILYGVNTFRLVFYGPQGEEKEEIQRFFIGNSLIRQGEFNYKLSVNEEERSVFEVLGNRSNKDDFLSATGVVDYGLTDKISVSLGAAHTPIIGESPRNYVTSGLNAAFWGVSTGADIAYDITNGGWGSKFTALTRLKGISLKAEQLYFQDFKSETETESLHYSTELDASGILTFPFLNNFSLGVNALNEVFEGGQKKQTLRTRMSKSLFGLNFSNQFESIVTQSENASGIFSVRGRFKGISLRADTEYSLQPVKELERMSIIGQARITEKLNSQLLLIQNFGDTKLTTLRSSFNWDLKHVRISTKVEYNTDDQLFVGTNLKFSIGDLPKQSGVHIQGNPMTNSGVVVANAFVDSNLDAMWQEGEEQVEIGAFKMHRKNYWIEDNIAVIPGIRSHVPTNITIAADSLEDPLWLPSVKGYQVETRPGAVIPISFPLMTTSEIDGTIYFQNANGEEKEVSDVIVQLVDSNGKVVKETLSEFDGFYIFDKILPGDYSIRIALEDLDANNFVMERVESLSVTKEGNFYSGYNITLLEQSDKEKQSEDIVTEPRNTLIEEPSDMVVEEPLSTVIIQGGEAIDSIIARYWIQVGAFRSKSLALERWKQIQSSYHYLLGTIDMRVVAVTFREKGTFYRVQVGAFGSYKVANAVCRDLKRKGQDCFVMEK